MWNQGYPVNWNAPINRGLLSWWLRPPVLVSNARFLDLCGRNHGTLIGGPLWSGASRPGGWGALSFNGTNSYVSIQPLALTAFTVSVWAQTRTVAVVQEVCNLQGDCAVLRLGHSTANRYTVIIQTGAGYYVLTSAKNIAANTSYHITATYDGELLSIFTDGVLDNSDASMSATLLTGSPDYIGVHNNGTANPFSGLLDDFRIYNRSLTADEVGRLYQASQTGYQYELNWIEDEEYRWARRGPRINSLLLTGVGR